MKKKFAIIAMLLIWVLPAISQEVIKPDEAPPRDKKNIYQGEPYRAFSIHADIFSPAMGIIANKNIRTFEIQADANFYDKLFPTIEAGYGQISTTLQEGQTYKSQAPFLRIGMNYNLIRNANKDGSAKHIRSYPFLGVRYGMGVFGYEMTGIPLSSGYWGTEQQYDFSKKAVYGGWLEIVGGIRVDIYRGLTMGWNVRLKTAFHSPDKAKLWWAAGYGFTSGSQFAFNYTIGYTFRTKTEREKDKALRLEKEQGKK